MRYVICDLRGTLLACACFPDGRAAMDWMDGVAGGQWAGIAAERGLPSEACPTLKWYRTEPPAWASAAHPAWIGRTIGRKQDPSELPHVAALEEEGD